jgi:hypothetical protein
VEEEEEEEEGDLSPVPVQPAFSLPDDGSASLDMTLTPSIECFGAGGDEDPFSGSSGDETAINDFYLQDGESSDDGGFFTPRPPAGAAGRG